MAERYPWRIFGILLGAGLFGVLAIMPYLLTVLENLPVVASLPPLHVLLFFQFLQSTVLLAIAVGVGLWLARKIGCGVPILEGWLAGEKIGSRLRMILRPSLAIGVGVGVILLLLLKSVFIPLIPQLGIVWGADVAIWKKLLASFYGGIVEELLMRLFLFSLLAWLLSKAWRTQNGLPSTVSFWLANVIAAIIFGLGHLASAPIMGVPITPIVVTAALLLNGIAGVAFGYLYWKQGLEGAIIAHFSADMALQGIGSLWLKV